MKRMAWIFGVFFLMAGSAYAGETVNILKVEGTQPEKAVMYLTVLDEGGRPIKGLGRDNFTVLIGGEEIKEFAVEPVSASREHLSVVLGLDVSGSMEGRPFEETKKAVSVFLDELDRGDYVCLMSCGTEVKFLTGFTDRRHEVREEVELLRPVDAWTHLNDAIYEAIEKGKGSPTARTAVILLTDGRDEGSVRGVGEVLDAAAGGSIPVFAIGYGNQIDAGYLGEIANVSGGYFLSTPEAEKIAGLYDRVLEQLENEYRMTFDFAGEPAYYKAVVRVAGAGVSAEGVREFLFNPSGEEVPLAVLHRMYKAAGLAVLLIVLMLGGFLYIQNRGRKAAEKERQERIATEGKRLQEQLNRIHDEIAGIAGTSAPQAPSPDKDDFVQFAIEIWRIEKRIAELSDILEPNQRKKLENSIQIFRRYFEDHDIEIINYTGRPITDGMNVEVISTEKHSSVDRPIVGETITPTVMYQKKIARKAKVIVHTGDKED